MSRSHRNGVPDELRDELVRIALQTDCIAAHKIDAWREAAVCAARWLLRTAALADERPRSFTALFKSVASLCDKVRGNGTSHTEADELKDVLRKYGVMQDDIS